MAESYDAGPGARHRKVVPVTDFDHLLELIGELTARVNELERCLEHGKAHAGKTRDAFGNEIPPAPWRRG